MGLAGYAGCRMGLRLKDLGLRVAADVVGEFRGSTQAEGHTAPYSIMSCAHNERSEKPAGPHGPAGFVSFPKRKR
jgi:hypothetical protein